MSVAPSVLKAQQLIRETRRFMVITVILWLGATFLPLVLGAPPAVTLGGVVLGGALYGFVMLTRPWEDYRRAVKLVAHHTRAVAEMDEDEPTSVRLAPIVKIAKRVRETASADPKVAVIVESLLYSLRSLDAELGELDDAIQRHRAKGASPRLDELLQERARKDAMVEHLIGAIRDLHVKLSVREGDDHETLYARIDSLVNQIRDDEGVDVTQDTTGVHRLIDPGTPTPAKKRKP